MRLRCALHKTGGDPSAVFRVRLSSHDLACAVTRLMATAAHAQSCDNANFHELGS
jgi:hypothetical protein